MKINVDLTNYRIPEYMVGGITRYLENGIDPGSFLSAVICNDLSGAVRCADNQNIHLLPEYVRFFYWEVPSDAWGSPEKMEAWMQSRSST